MLSKLIKEVNANQNKNSEQDIIMKSIRINTCPKLTNEDSIRFDFLLKDTFPGFDIKDFELIELEEKLMEVIEELKLEQSKIQVLKIIQFQESFNQRIGVTLVGPSGSGKSTIWTLCKLALEKMGRKIRIFPLNPKAISKNMLLGE